MEYLLYLLVILGVITVIGHLIWIGIASLIRPLWGESEPGDQPQQWQPCPGCRGSVAPGRRHCQECGLDLYGQTARELSDLDGTMRQLRRFLDKGLVDAATSTQLKRECRQARAQLLGKPLEEGLEGEYPQPAWRRLERLLAECEDVRGLDAGQRQQALAWYRAAQPQEMATFRTPLQWDLARLLALEGETGPALAVFTRLLRDYPDLPSFTEIALEAAELAAAQGQHEQALRYLRQSESRGIPAFLQERFRRLQERLEYEQGLPEVTLAEAPPAPAQIPQPVVAGPQPVSPPSLPKVEVPPAEPEPPRRTFGQMLAGFMEEKNIFWGELVGGILIVGCSIALVISLWQTLESIWYFPFLIFAGITSALFGAGLYTLKHWRLESTSRGLLAIALLLVPLNFLVLAGLPGEDRLLKSLIGAGSLGLFVWLVSSAARVIVPGQRGLLTLALIGPAAGQLLVPSMLPSAPEARWVIWLLAGIPVIIHVLCCGSVVFRTGRPFQVSESSARELLIFLGLSLFTLATALGFITSRAGLVPWVLESLALPVALSVIPILAGGLLLYRGSLRPGGEGTLPAWLHTVGSGVTLGGMALILGTSWLAWPSSPTLMALGLLDFAVLSALAFGYRLPPAHAVALACLTFAFLFGFHLLTGKLVVDLDVLLAPGNGSALLVLVSVLALASEGLVRWGRRIDGSFYAAGAGVLVVASLVLVHRGGFSGEPIRAAATCLVCAVMVLALNGRWRLAGGNHAGLALMLLGTLWVLEALWHGPQPGWALILALESLVMGTTALVLDLKETTLGRKLQKLNQAISASAWRDLAAAAGILAMVLALSEIHFSQEALHAGIAGLLALVASLLAWNYRQPALSWLAVLLLFRSLLYAVAATFETSILFIFLGGLLGLAALTFGLGVALGRVGKPLLRSLLAVPLRQASLLASLAAIPLLFFIRELPDTGILAPFAGWLAVIWLAMAWYEKRAVLFSAAQAATAVAVVFGVTWWLQGQDWFTGDPSQLLDPRSLQAYGMGLAGLALFWILARLGLNRGETSRALFEPAWPSVDHVLLGLVVLGQLGLATIGVFPAALHELIPAGQEVVSELSQVNVHTFGPGAWALLGVVALALIAALWNPPALWDRPKGAVLGLILAAITLPVLWAGPWIGQLATASALRWSLSLCFLVVSGALWLHGPIACLARFLRIETETQKDLLARSRQLLLGLTVVPVFLLTLVVALIGFSGQRTSGPEEASFFYRVGWVASQIVPLIFVGIGLLGHGVRERLPGYTFAAGLVGNVSLMGGYALVVLLGGGVLDQVIWVRLIQLGTIGAAAWAFLWLWGRRGLAALWPGFEAGLSPGQRWARAWQEGPDKSGARQLLTFQVGLALLGLCLFLYPALGWLVLPGPDFNAAQIGPPYPQAANWTKETGAPLGWLALGLSVITFGLGLRRPVRLAEETSLKVLLEPIDLGTGLRRPLTHVFGLSGLASVALLACSVERFAPGWGYRTLMLGMAGLALAWVAALVVAAFRPFRRETGIALGLSDVAPVWITTGSVLALMLGLKAAFAHQDPLWAAIAIGIASLAGAALGVQRRQEGVAFIAGLGVNLAASLLVWFFHINLLITSWGLILLEANASASAVVALLWLWWRRQFYGPRELRVVRVPLLAWQVGLALVACLALTIMPLLPMVFNPGSPLSAGLAEAGEVWGWATLLLTLIAAFWQVWRAGPWGRIHIIGLGALLAVVLGACTVDRWNAPGLWLSYYTLLMGWSSVGLGLTAAGIIAAAFRWSGQATDAWRAGNVSDRRAGTPFGPVFNFVAESFPPISVKRWAIGVGLTVVLLAIRGRAGPQEPLWSVLAAFSVLITSVSLALWFRRPGPIMASGLLLHLISLLLWNWETWTHWDLLSVQALCLGIGAAFWAGLGLTLRWATPSIDLHRPALPYRFGALIGGLLLVAYLAFVQIMDNLYRLPRESSFMALPAYFSLVVALGLGLWDIRNRFTTVGLYLAGLLGVGLILGGLETEPQHLGWLASVLLAGYTLLTAGIYRAFAEQPNLKTFLRLAGREEDPARWFPPLEAFLGAVALVLSLWICLAFDNTTFRLGAPLTLALLIGTGFLLAVHGSIPRQASLLLGVVFLTELSWAFLEPSIPAPWIHRNILLMAALAIGTVAYGVGLARQQRLWPAWAECGRRLGPPLGVVALLVLLGVLGQEMILCKPKAIPPFTPLYGWEIALVAVALAGLFITQIRFAVWPGSDPFGLSEPRRTVYVYLAEVLLLGLFLHFRMNIPHVGQRLMPYWPFLIMGVAFVGVGLGEFFHRRNLPVLAGPLQRTGVFLPLLPLLAFWVQPPEYLMDRLQGSFPGLQPLLLALQKLPMRYQAPESQFHLYSLLWFLVGALYMAAALGRRSGRYALLAALAANVGLWCLLHHASLKEETWALLRHPQLWLIPLALIVLVSEHLNRARLGPVPSAGLRYTGLGLLYLSSTADMFIAKLGQSVILPLVLAVLSVLGVLAGILLRVRAFLFLGITFLGLVVFSMIWHAAVDRAQTWVWWASGIVLGIAILSLFALFEKKRNEMLRMVEEIRKWD